jgi:hypothetical protein
MVFEISIGETFLTFPKIMIPSFFSMMIRPIGQGMKPSASFIICCRRYMPPLYVEMFAVVLAFPIVIGALILMVNIKMEVTRNGNLKNCTVFSDGYVNVNYLIEYLIILPATTCGGFDCMTILTSSPSFLNVFASTLTLSPTLRSSYKFASSM